MSKKTIWITGGSTGIGRALAIKFASEGWNVAVSARRTELLNELKKLMRILFLGDVVGITGCLKIQNNLLDQIKIKKI